MASSPAVVRIKLPGQHEKSVLSLLGRWLTVCPFLFQYAPPAPVTPDRCDLIPIRTVALCGKSRTFDGGGGKGLKTADAPPPFLLVAPSGRRRTSCKCAAEEPICCFIGLPLVLHRVGYAARVQICLFVCPHRQSSFSSLARPAPGTRNERRRVVGKELRPSFKRRQGRSVVVWWRVCQLGHAIDDDDDNDGEAPRARAASRQFRPDMSVADGGKVTCEAIPKRHACFSGGLAEIGAHARASVMLVVCLGEEGGASVFHTPRRERDGCFSTMPCCCCQDDSSGEGAVVTHIPSRSPHMSTHVNNDP